MYILTQESNVYEYCSLQDLAMVLWEVSMYGKIVIVFKGTHLGALDSYPSSLPISFSLSSTSFNHPRSMHSVHCLPYLKLEKSSLVGLSQIVST